MTLEIKPVKPAHRAGPCQGGCKSGPKKTIPKIGNRQVWIMGRDAGHWCLACSKKWQALFDEAAVRLASSEAPQATPRRRERGTRVKPGGPVGVGEPALNRAA